MKKHVLCGLFVIGMLICLGSTTAKAQENKFNLFGGYSYGTNNLDNCNSSVSCFSEDPGHHGYAAAFTYNFNNHIGLEANFSGHNGRTTEFNRPGTSSENGENISLTQDIYTYTFGPKLSQQIGNFVLFTHFLVGATHYHAGAADVCPGGPECFTGSSAKGSFNGMAFKTGAGVDWNHGRWGLRILEVDYVHDQLSGTLTCGGSCTTAPTSGPVSGGGVELSTGVTFNFGK